MAWLAASGDRSLAMRWAVRYPVDLLVVGLIHLFNSIDSGGIPISHSIFLLSPSASGLWVTGMYSTMIETDLSLIIDDSP